MVIAWLYIIRATIEMPRRRPMSEHQEPTSQDVEAPESDSVRDVIAAIAIIGIAVVFAVFWVSNQ